MDLSNVSRRLKAVRQLLRPRLSSRGLDKLAGRPAGTCAIIEGKEQESVRFHVGSSYASALGVSTGWLMSGSGPAIEAHPELDLSRPGDVPSIRALVLAATEAAALRLAAAKTATPKVTPKEAAPRKSLARKPSTKRATPATPHAAAV